MAILSLAFKSLWNRKLTFFITLFSIAISVALLLGVQTLKNETKTSFMKSISGTDLIIGARGASSQLLLSSVFHIGNTANTLKYESYQEIAQSPAVKWAVPISLGDSHQGYTVMATNLNFFEHFSYANKQKLTTQQGKISDDMFAVVIGADVAKKLSYKIGDSVVMTHGDGEIDGHDHDNIPYFISAILAPSFTAIDQTLIISLEAMEAMHTDDHGHFGALPNEEVILHEQESHDKHDDHQQHASHQHHEQENHDKHDDHQDHAGHQHHEQENHDKHDEHQEHAGHQHHEQENHDSHDDHQQHAGHQHHEQENHDSHDDHQDHAGHQHHEHENHDKHDDHQDHAGHQHHETESHDKHDDHQQHAGHQHHEQANHDSHDEHEGHQHHEHENHDKHDDHQGHQHHEQENHDKHDDHQDHAGHQHHEHENHDAHDDHSSHAGHDHHDTPEQRIARLLKIKPENINAIFVGLTSRQAVLGMQNYVNNFKAEPLSAIMPAVALQELWSFFSIAEVALNIVTVFVVLVGLLGMLSIILMSLNERRREMAILRSVGARPGHIFALIIGEAAAVCFSGIVVGITLLYALLFTLQTPLANYFGFYLEINMLTSNDLLILATIQISALIIAVIPGLLIYKTSLSDGMSIKF